MESAFFGIGLHAAGGASSASSIVPAKFVRAWDWNVYWLAFATVSLVILPVLGVIATIPDPLGVIVATPMSTILSVVALGFLYGFGSYAFGWAIRLIGFSLTYCISIGLSATLGTIIPPVVLGGEPLRRLLETSLGGYVAGALVLGLAGMATVGAAGRRKELLRTAASAGDSAPARSKMLFGFAVAVGAGILSAAYGLALSFGAPIADAAARAGASPLLKVNIVFLFANGAAFLSTLLIVIPQIVRARVGRQFISAAGTDLVRNYTLAIVGGAAWYFQFFFFGMAEFYMGAFSAASWAIHMILLIVFAQAWGIYFREWRDVDRQTLQRLVAGLALLVGAVLVVAIGNATGG